MFRRKDVYASMWPILTPFMWFLNGQAERALVNRLRVDTSALEVFAREEKSTVPALLNNCASLEVGAHSSYLDFAIQTRMRKRAGLKFPYIITGDNLTTGFIGWLAKHSGSLAIDRERTEGGNFRYLAQVHSEVTKKLRNRDHLLIYPTGGRTRTGSFLERKGSDLGMVGGTAARFAKENDLIVLVSAISYDFNQDMAEFEREQKGDAQPHHGFVKTFGSYVGADSLFASLFSIYVAFPLTNSWLRNSAETSAPFGNAYAVYARPIIAKSMSRDDIGAAVSKAMGEVITPTNTGVVLALFADNPLLCKDELLCLFERTADQIESVHPHTALSSNRREGLDEALYRLYRSYAICRKGELIEANRFMADYMAENLRPVLDKVSRARA